MQSTSVRPHDPTTLSRRAFLQTTGGAAAAATAVVASGPAGAQALPVAADGLQAVALRVNGVEHRLAIEARVTLLDALREHIGLMGTKKGCDRGQCGACTVLADGQRINACLTLAAMREGQEITTIEGLGSPVAMHPLQGAFIDKDAFQCGYCTPGQICSAAGMLAEWRAGSPSAASADVRQAANTTAISDAEIRERMSGNLCRCGAYPNIVAAIRLVAAS